MWAFLQQHPIASIGMVIGAFIAVGALLNDVYSIVDAGLSPAAWEAIGSVVFFVSVIVLLFRWSRTST
jgi:hypothetical protein